VYSVRLGRYRMDPAAKSRPYYRLAVTMQIIRIYIRINIHASIGSEPIQPVVVIGRELGIFDGTGIGRIRQVAGVAGRIIFLLIHGPVTGSQGCRDQDKLNAGGLFHNGVAVGALIKVLRVCPLCRYCAVIGKLFNCYPHPFFFLSPPASVPQHCIPRIDNFRPKLDSVQFAHEAEGRNS
jgi:hypothetical protein